MAHIETGSPAAQWWRLCLRCSRLGFDPWVGKIPWRRKWRPTPVLLLSESHGQRSLVGYNPCGHKRVGQDLVAKPPQGEDHLSDCRFVLTNCRGQEIMEQHFPSALTEELSTFNFIFRKKKTVRNERTITVLSMKENWDWSPIDLLTEILQGKEMAAERKLELQKEKKRSRNGEYNHTFFSEIWNTWSINGLKTEGEIDAKSLLETSARPSW